MSVTCHRSVVFFGSFINKTDRHDITEILLKVALNTIKPTNRETPYTSYIVFGLTGQVLEHTTYRTQCQYASHYATDVQMWFTKDEVDRSLTLCDDYRVRKGLTIEVLMSLTGLVNSKITHQTD